MKIHCCECDKNVNARLTKGEEVYPHRVDFLRSELRMGKIKITKSKEAYENTRS